MRRLLCLLLLICAPAWAQSERPPSEAALALADAIGASGQLRGFLRSVTAGTSTIRGVVTKFGELPVMVILDEEIERAAAQLDAQCRTNLARAYAQALSEEEMHSLATERERSPHLDKLAQVRSEAGARMREMSEPLLVSAGQAVVNETFVRASKLNETITR